MLAFLIAASTAPVIAGHEPRAASPWIQSTKATCGNNVISISGYGAAKPLDSRASISLNARPASGAKVARLLSDLSSRRAAYRLIILCAESSEITLQIVRGEKLADRTIQFHSGAASFRGSQLVSYTGLQESNAETFWFR
jgi:hypothetical protein